LGNFSTGFQGNLDEAKEEVSGKQLSRFIFLEGDIRNISTCKEACRGVDDVLVWPLWVPCIGRVRLKSIEVVRILMAF
jgi:hypothetical protein